MGKIFTFFDVETTGLDTFNDDVLSFGFIRLNEEYKVVNQGTLYFYRDDFEIEKAQHIHHLSREFLKQHEDSFENNAAMMWTILHESNIFGKNSKNYDIKIINNFLLRYFPALGQSRPASHVDTQDYIMHDYRKKFGTTKKGTLEQYKDMYGITDDYVMQFIPEREKANRLHTALFDSWVTLLTFFRYCRDHNMSL